jgi:hypothetical protein
MEVRERIPPCSEPEIVIPMAKIATLIAAVVAGSLRRPSFRLARGHRRSLSAHRRGS